LSDARRAIVGCANFEIGGKGFVHHELESALAKLVSGHEASGDAVDQGVLLQDLQGLFDLQDAHRFSSGPTEPVAKEVLPEAAGALDLDVRETPFDDLQYDDTRVDLLVWQNRPRRDVTMVVIELADRVARSGEILGAERPALEGRYDRSQRLRRKHAAAFDDDPLDICTTPARQPKLLLFGYRWRRRELQLGERFRLLERGRLEACVAGADALLG
jgi:hypothetical protein